MRLIAHTWGGLLIQAALVFGDRHLIRFVQNQREFNTLAEDCDELEAMGVNMDVETCELNHPFTPQPVKDLLTHFFGVPGDPDEEETNN